MTVIHRYIEFYRTLIYVCLQGILRCLARAVVKFVHEQGELHRHFGANVRRMAAAMAADSLHSQGTSIISMERLCEYVCNHATSQL